MRLPYFTALCALFLSLTGTQAQAMPTRSPADIQQVKCMADNVYYEARNQSDKGMIAVSNVVMNRTHDTRFASTPCGVVKQKKHRTCQFSWVCEHHRQPVDLDLYERGRRLAEGVYFHRIPDITHGAIFYHAYYDKPMWSRRFAKVAYIGAHIFYRG